MDKYRKISEFNPETDHWQQYVEQIGFYVEANDREKEKIKAIFLSVCGSIAYSILRDLCQPGKSADEAITYDELVKRVSEHFAPRPSMLVQRYKFN